MTNASSAAQVTAVLGDVRSLAEQVGRSDGQALVPAAGIWEACRSVPALRTALAAHGRDVLAAQEWPMIVRAHELARAGQARELVALDREWTATAADRQFSEASFRVGQRQLNRLRPLRDQRVVQKYLAAVEAGEARGWHPLVYGIVLAVFNLPLRQGLMNFAAQTLGGFADAAIEAHRLPEGECVRLLDELCATLPASLPPLPDAGLFAAA
ncbi:MAG TPA: urease accessory UreF family protein [Candidatus Limnocylindria bacterium]|jgi:urease accessory protein UreF|nr:urease accessory UreF family protein [Candidatus Limnocylindria bacterium]